MERSHLVDAPFQGRGVVLGAIQLPSNWERLALAASTRPRRRRTRVPGLAAGEHGVPSTNRRAERFGHVIRALGQGGVESSQLVAQPAETPARQHVHELPGGGTPVVTGTTTVRAEMVK